MDIKKYICHENAEAKLLFINRLLQHPAPFLELCRVQSHASLWCMGTGSALCYLFSIRLMKLTEYALQLKDKIIDYRFLLIQISEEFFCGFQIFIQFEFARYLYVFLEHILNFGFGILLQGCFIFKKEFCIIQIFLG